MTLDTSWAQVENAAAIATPGLLVYPQRIEANIARMLEVVAGDATRLRPHVKTHKMLPIIRLQMAAGIDKFKCATIAEAELCAEAGAADVLLAYQPVGPNIKRLAALAKRKPATSFATAVDSPAVARELSRRFEKLPLRVFVDIDAGMHRTGIAPTEEAISLANLIDSLPGVIFAGLHVYDGHIHHSCLAAREAACREAFAPIREFVDRLSPPAVVAGGSPTFLLHAANSAWQCSPGTALLWDAGYGEKFPDLGFQPAAALLTRVVSRPARNRLCLDLGYKAVAAENPIDRRVRIPSLTDAQFLMQSEEHLVVETRCAHQVEIGSEMYALPVHICPTVALYARAVVIRAGRATGEQWSVRARDRMLSV